MISDPDFGRFFGEDYALLKLNMQKALAHLSQQKIQNHYEFNNYQNYRGYIKEAGMHHGTAATTGEC